LHGICATAIELDVGICATRLLDHSVRKIDTFRACAATRGKVHHEAGASCNIEKARSFTDVERIKQRAVGLLCQFTKFRL
jgi:hypothetical protein